MKIAGIIAEYNPFHNGHALHIQRTREMTHCDYVVVCMAGNLTQRGEPACLSKWDRARAALLCGADAVFELPAIDALRPADRFAWGGVSILNALGCDCLSFGCEEKRLDLLEKLAELRENEPEEMERSVREKLRQGMSHARARSSAAEEILRLDAGELNRPNLTLGVEYLRALKRLNSDMEICLVERVGGYHDLKLGTIASASAIRASLALPERFRESVPECVFQMLAAEAPGHFPDDLLIWKLRTSDAAELSALLDMGEGLENRLLKCAKEAANREDLLERLKCRRYTRARLSRILLYVLLDLRADFALRHPDPSYARLIGFRRDAAPLMKELSVRTQIPICSDPTLLRENPVFALECRASDLWALARGDHDSRRAGREFFEKFLCV